MHHRVQPVGNSARQLPNRVFERHSIEPVGRLGRERNDDQRRGLRGRWTASLATAQNRGRSSPVSARNAWPCENPADGAADCIAQDPVNAVLGTGSVLELVVS